MPGMAEMKSRRPDPVTSIASDHLPFGDIRIGSVYCARRVSGRDRPVALLVVNASTLSDSNDWIPIAERPSLLQPRNSPIMLAELYCKRFGRSGSIRYG